MNDPTTDAQQEPPVEASPVDANDRHDVLTQQIIDDLARSSRGRQHAEVVAELAESLAERGLPAKPGPWLDAVAAEAITGNAYVVTALTARVCDVPKPDIDRSGKTVN